MPGRQHRAARRAEPGLPPVLPLPALPLSLGASLLPSITGSYVGTEYASGARDRVTGAALGAPADVLASLHRDGVLINRSGAEPIFLPTAAITGARLGPVLAGHVAGAGGLLVISWRLGETDLDTGLHAEDRSAYPLWLRALSASAGTLTVGAAERGTAHA